LKGAMPKIFSSENILPPIHSAIKAFATKKAVIPKKSFVGLSLSILVITKAVLSIQIIE
jgi:hypothetical protein